MKRNQRSGKSEVGILSAQDRDVLSSDLRVFSQINCGCASGRDFRRVTRIREKGDLTRLGLLKPGRAGDFNIRVARFANRSSLGREFGEFHQGECSAGKAIRAPDTEAGIDAPT